MRPNENDNGGGTLTLLEKQQRMAEKLFFVVVVKCLGRSNLKVYSGRSLGTQSIRGMALFQEQEASSHTVSTVGSRERGRLSLSLPPFYLAGIPSPWNGGTHV